MLVFLFSSTNTLDGTGVTVHVMSVYTHLGLVHVLPAIPRSSKLGEVLQIGYSQFLMSWQPVVSSARSSHRDGLACQIVTIWVFDLVKLQRMVQHFWFWFRSGSRVVHTTCLWSLFPHRGTLHGDHLCPAWSPKLYYTCGSTFVVCGTCCGLCLCVLVQH